MISIKNSNVFQQVIAVPWHPKLIDLVEWFDKKWGNVIITCAYERRNYPSVHSLNPLRGVDIRSRNFADPAWMEKEINEHWVYDSDRPSKKCCIYHDVGRGRHFHLQVHENTFHMTIS